MGPTQCAAFCANLHFKPYRLFDLNQQRTTYPWLQQQLAAQPTSDLKLSVRVVSGPRVVRRQQGLLKVCCGPLTLPPEVKDAQYEARKQERQHAYRDDQGPPRLLAGFLQRSDGGARRRRREWWW